MKANKTGKYTIIILASLALHIVFFYGTVFVNDFLALNELYKRLDHTIVDRSKDISTQIELIDRREKAKQIVEQKKVTDEKKEPKDSKFLSASNQIVKKETKARHSGAFQNSKSQQMSQAVNSKAQKKITAKELMSMQKRTSLTKDGLGLKGLKPSFNPNQILKRRAQEASRQVASNSSMGLGPSQTDDYLEGIDVADQTLLNTKKFRFYSFYSRVKGQLRNHWTPLIRQQVSFYFSTGRSVASLDKKKTSLRITLNKHGYLEKIELLGTSGNKSLDSAAINAFRSAAPFLNPPKELLETDKKIRLFWDFVLES